MKLFGNTVKFLLAQRGLTSKEFAERINLSPTSLSKIVNGVTRPRQANLTRIIEELCESHEEKQQLLSAFEQVEEQLAEETPQADLKQFRLMEEDRVRRYLQAKAQSIAFREQVAEVLRESGQAFESPHHNDDVICDFFLPGPPRIAIECKANPNRDWDRTIASIRLFLKDLPADFVVVAVSNEEIILSNDCRRVEKSGGRIAELGNLKEVLS